MTTLNTINLGTGTKSTEVADVLRERIEQKVYTDKLPGMAILAENFGVNVRTVMRGVAALEREGVLTRKRGQGTFITRLKRPRTHTIGAVFGGIVAPLGAQLAAGMQMAAETADQGLTLSSYGNKRGSQMERIQNLVERNQVDGLVLWLIGIEVEKEAVAYLKNENIPFVLVPDYEPGNPRYMDVHTVSGADRGATADVMMHLMGQGHRDIAFAGDFKYGESIFHQHRYDEYCRTLSLAGLSPRKGLNVPYDVEMPPTDARILAQLKTVTAVFCETDRVASAVHRICVREGIRIPDDLAVVGFDNSQVAEMLGISSVEQNFERIGQKAVELLLDDVEGNLLHPTHLEEESELIIRGSSVKNRPQQSLEKSQ